MDKSYKKFINTIVKPDELIETSSEITSKDHKNWDLFTHVARGCNGESKSYWVSIFISLDGIASVVMWPREEKRTLFAMRREYMGVAENIALNLIETKKVSSFSKINWYERVAQKNILKVNIESKLKDDDTLHLISAEWVALDDKEMSAVLSKCW